MKKGSLKAESLAYRWVALLLSALLLTSGCATLGSPLEDAADTQDRPSCGGRAVPAGWPDFSDDSGALLAPFLTCASPAQMLALQARVDMPRLVQALDEWHAVRLGAQGTPREEAARPLNRKRASFLSHAPEHYGVARAEVLSLFVVHSAHDDDLRDILFFLAQDKRLEELLELLPAFRVALETRGLKPTARPDRDFEWGDIGRGLARAGGDALASAPVELESSGPRLPRSVAVLEKQRPSLASPPPEAQGNPRWAEYVSYYEKRLGEVKEGTADKGPMVWEAYEQMRGWFARGLAFERVMVRLLQADAQLPRAERRFLGDFDRPRIETSVGVKKPGPGLRYADVLVIEEGESAGGARRVETFSFKSRDLVKLERDALRAQVLKDAMEAVRNYGETLDIRRDSLRSLLRKGREVNVTRVRLIYEGDALSLTELDDFNMAVDATRMAVPGVEVLIQ